MKKEPYENAGNEPERYELREQPRYRFELNRRNFVQFVGAGLLVTSTGGIALAQRRRRSSRGVPVSARLHIGEDGLVTVFTSKVEVGQGARTQLAQAVAEELRVPLDAVRMVMADTALVPNDGGTYGSLTTPMTVPRVREGAAAAREILLDMACRQWKCSRKDVEARDGAAVHRKKGTRLPFAELVKSDTLPDAYNEPPVGDAPLRSPSQWDVLGTPVLKSTGLEIVTGTHRYPSDIVREDMLFGTVLRPPSYGATLLSIDLSPGRSIENVVVVRDGDFVGCAAPTSFQARQAVEAIAQTAQWDRPPHPPSSQLYDYLRKGADAGRKPRTRTKGSIEEGFQSAKNVFSATFEIPYIQHVPMEPRAAVAEWTGDGVTIWTGTQRPNGVRGEVARAFSIPSDKVRIIVPDTGGGFGGKHTGEAAIEAARLAKGADRPVSLQWTRDEEFMWAYFRPAGVIDVKAGLASDGTITAWQFRNINSGASGLTTPYRVPNTQTQFSFCESPLREGSYRVLAATANNFARETFMDELARAAGKDPLAFRLAHLDDGRLRAVLEQAAREFGWDKRYGRSGSDTAVGLSCGTEKGSFVAACAEVSLRDGNIRVKEIVQAFECGAIQNPENLRSQVEGCIVMGLGGALLEAIRFQDGRILNGKLSLYAVPRFKDVPAIKTVLLNRPDLPSTGAGESPIICVAPAIANALAPLLGRPVRSLPITA